MKNLKGNSVTQIIIAVVVTALVVVGAGYYFYNSQIAELKNEVKKLQTTSSQTTTTKNTSSDSTTTTTTPSNPETLQILGLSFALPKGWSLDKTTKSTSDTSSSKTVYFKVPDSKYNVVMPVNVSISNYKVSEDDKTHAKEATTSSGAEIYKSGCAPAIACYYLVYNNKTYDVTFQTVNSDEPAPKDLDGVWFPSTTVTKNDILSFLKTVK